ncbi:FMN-binding negative transcriptional regulator [Streptomycetaceae bacterium NBC_01309]
MTTYVPSWLPQPTLAYALDFARRISFATVILLDATDPVVSHLPIEVDPGGDERAPALRFHVASGNALAERLDEESQLLAIFRGVDGYISPTWYDHENVPTWNYAAVHMQGPAAPLTEDALRAHLLALLESQDAHLGVREEFIEQYVPDIRGFTMTSPRIEPVFKLSQDKNRASFDGAITGLRAACRATLADEMSSLKRHLDD